MNSYFRTIFITLGISLFWFPETYLTKAQEFQLVQNLSSEEIALEAKQITVKIEGVKGGSGIIISRSNNSYTVLTNWHVVKTPGKYIVQTLDGEQHEIDSATIQRLSTLDLAVFKFNSEQAYQVARIGDSNQLNVGQNLYFAGYPGEQRTAQERSYYFYPVNLVSRLSQPESEGYALVYGGSSLSGMSGGPVFDNKGLLVGIHGKADFNPVTGSESNYAIPVNSYKEAIASLPIPPQPQGDDDDDDDGRGIIPTFDGGDDPPETIGPGPTPPIKPIVIDDVPKTRPRPLNLISTATGIDYSSLQALLTQEKWREADRKTSELVSNIIKTIKRRNNRTFIEIYDIADRACDDIYTIDALWRKSSSDRFGFTPQQDIWNNVNQSGDFSTETWRTFATKIGWKKGEISNGGGYLLYEQLSFDSHSAPFGHLPWWFDYSEEDQKVLKQVLIRCNLKDEEIIKQEEVTNTQQSTLSN